MKLGAQVSVSGGLYKAFKNAEDIGAETLMFYTRSNRQWKAKPISEADQARFKETADSYVGRIDSCVVPCQLSDEFGLTRTGKVGQIICRPSR